jgi:hypothetical protein
MKTTDLASIKPEYSPRNPKIDFFGHDGRYLYSSNWYRSCKHAWAHVSRNPVSGYTIVGRIERTAGN